MPSVVAWVEVKSAESERGPGKKELLHGCSARLLLHFLLKVRRVQSNARW